MNVGERLAHESRRVTERRARIAGDQATTEALRFHLEGITP